MIKNFKKTFVSILALVFSSCCVVTFADVYTPLDVAYPQYFAKHYDYEEDYDDKDYNDEDYDDAEYDDTDYCDVDNGADYYDHNMHPYVSKQSFPNVSQKILHKLYSSLDESPNFSCAYNEYRYLCQNLYKFIKNKDNYKDVRNKINGYSCYFYGVNLIQTKLNERQRETVLNVLNELKILGCLKFDLDFLLNQTSLNLFDLIYARSCICNTTVALEYKLPIENILISNKIDSKTFAPIS